MMKQVILSTALLTVWACGAIGKAAGGEGALQPRLLAQAHFVGAERLWASPKLGHLKEIRDLSATKAFWDAQQSKWTDAIRELLAPGLEDGGSENSPALEAILQDWLESPSFVQVWDLGDQPPAWVLAVGLSGEQAGHWKSELRRLLEAAQPAKALGLRLSQGSGWEIKRETALRVFRLVDLGDWVVIYDGPDRLPFFRRALDQFHGRPLPEATDEGGPLLTGRIDFQGLDRRLDLPGWAQGPPGEWPQARFTVTNRADQLRLRVRLDYDEEIAPEVESWQIPTDTIQDPLVSFTAWRGVKDWLQRLGVGAKLGFESPPNQLFVWAQSDTPFQTYVTFPSNEVTERVKEATAEIRDWLDPVIKKRNLGEIQWLSERGETQWKGLPFVVPFLRPVSEAAGQFIQLGMFPSVPSSQPPPKELLAEVQGDDNLLYYDWEITEMRLSHWRTLVQLVDVIRYEPWQDGAPPKPEEGTDPRSRRKVLPKPSSLASSKGDQWLKAIEPFLGNTVTQVRLAEPDRLELVRGSHLGFTGLELLQLVRWLENVGAGEDGKKQAALPIFSRAIVGDSDR